MKTIDIVIPTLNRLEKLKRMLASVPKLDWVKAKIVFDNDPIRHPHEKDRHSCPQQSQFIRSDWYRDEEKRKVIGSIISMEMHRGSAACRNYITPLCMDGVLPATDDVVFRPGAFEKMLKQFNDTFPDDDGVLGIRQHNEEKRFHPTGVCLVGQQFLQRYPGKLLYYPRYFHFAAQEIWWHAETVKRFAVTEEILLDHLHPGFMPEEMDETHKITASHRTLDHMVRNARKKAGSIWGYDE